MCRMVGCHVHGSGQRVAAVASRVPRLDMSAWLLLGRGCRWLVVLLLCCAVLCCVPQRLLGWCVWQPTTA
jgi:hypothetical protein